MNVSTPSPSRYFFSSLSSVSMRLFLVFFVVGITTTSFAMASTEQPTVVAVSPQNNALDVEQTAEILVWFSEEMDARSITSDTFTVTQRATLTDEPFRSRPVSGTISYSGMQAVFTPDEKMQPNQRYGNMFTAMLSQDIADVSGNTLARDYVWSFSTGTDNFATGASTAQSDQTSTMTGSEPVSPTPVTPAPATSTPATTTPATTSTATTVFNTLPWSWIIGALVVLVLILFIALSVWSSNRESPRRVHDVRTVSHTGTTAANAAGTTSTRTSNDPFGDIHSVSSLEGIGPEYSERLASIGILDTQELWTADAKEISDSIDVPLVTVKSWQHMAELSSVKSIGPQYAELLDRSGVHSIASLRTSTPDKLLAQVQKKQESLKINIQGNTLGRATVSNWITEARNHSYST